MYPLGNILVKWATKFVNHGTMKPPLTPPKTTIIDMIGWSNGAVEKSTCSSPYMVDLKRNFVDCLTMKGTILVDTSTGFQQLILESLTGREA